LFVLLWTKAFAREAAVRDEYVVQPSTIRPRFFTEDGGDEESVRVYLDGLDGGPDAVMARHSDNAMGSRHFHHGSQFQFTLEGVATFRQSDNGPLSVFYTDHNTAYGPFRMLDNHRMLVLHPRPAGQVFLRDPGSGKDRNPNGRHIFGAASTAEWENVPECPGGRRKVLISAEEGPMVELRDLPAGAELNFGPSTYGRFEFVVDGNASLEGATLERETLRFVRGDRAFSPLVAGEGGAMFAVLCFDDDAVKGEQGGISIADRVAQFEEITANEAKLVKVDEELTS
jgi:hypothetical protein